MSRLEWEVAAPKTTLCFFTMARKTGLAKNTMCDERVLRARVLDHLRVKEAGSKCATCACNVLDLHGG